MNCRLFSCVLIALIALPSWSLELSDYRLVDLSHAYDNETLYWPTSPSRFDKQELAYGPSAGGWFYASFQICTPEHGGTHLDAPRHFSDRGLTTDQLPLGQLIAPAVVIDVRAKAQIDRDYRLGVADVLNFEKQHAISSI